MIVPSLESGMIKYFKKQQILRRATPTDDHAAYQYNILEVLSEVRKGINDPLDLIMLGRSIFYFRLQLVRRQQNRPPKEFGLSLEFWLAR